VGKIEIALLTIGAVRIGVMKLAPRDKKLPLFWRSLEAFTILAAVIIALRN
jgi:hypothetical protein